MRALSIRIALKEEVPSSTNKKERLKKEEVVRVESKKTINRKK